MAYNSTIWSFDVTIVWNANLIIKQQADLKVAVSIICTNLSRVGTVLAVTTINYLPIEVSVTIFII